MVMRGKRKYLAGKESMAKPYNSTAVTEVLVAITSALYRTGTYPFTEDAFDAWQTTILRMMERMSDQLSREDGTNERTYGVVVLEPDMVSYEDMMSQFRRLLDEGIFKYPPASTWMNNNR